MIPPSGFSWPLGAGLHNLGHILWPKLVEALDFLFCVTTELLTCVFPRRRHRSFTEKGSVSWWSWRLETILRTYVVGPQVPSISFIISCMVPHLSTRREQLWIRLSPELAGFLIICWVFGLIWKACLSSLIWYMATCSPTRSDWVTDQNVESFWPWQAQLRKPKKIHKVSCGVKHIKPVTFIEIL